MIINGKRPFKQRTKQGLTIAPMKSGRYVLRVKSSLTAKRVKTDPVFKPLMAEAGLMKIASPLAARVYRALGVHNVKVYREMVGRAKGLLKAGEGEADIEVILNKEFGPVEIVAVSTGEVQLIEEGQLTGKIQSKEKVQLNGGFQSTERIQLTGKIQSKEDIPLIKEIQLAGAFQSNRNAKSTAGNRGKIIPLNTIHIFKLSHFSSFYKSSA